VIRTRNESSRVSQTHSLEMPFEREKSAHSRNPSDAKSVVCLVHFFVHPRKASAQSATAGENRMHSVVNHWMSEASSPLLWVQVFSFLKLRCAFSRSNRHPRRYHRFRFHCRETPAQTRATPKQCFMDQSDRAGETTELAHFKSSRLSKTCGHGNAQFEGDSRGFHSNDFASDSTSVGSADTATPKKGGNARKPRKQTFLICSLNY
jgi:hypothetical protein